MKLTSATATLLDQFSYSRIPPYSYSVSMATSLILPLYCGPNKTSVSHFSISFGHRFHCTCLADISRQVIIVPVFKLLCFQHVFIPLLTIFMPEIRQINVPSVFAACIPSPLQLPSVIFHPGQTNQISLVIDIRLCLDRPT